MMARVLATVIENCQARPYNCKYGDEMASTEIGTLMFMPSNFSLLVKLSENLK